ncbi:GPALPP motifs-containing protein 1-like [Lingula anatina]|uniref:GPALPP motifs-containing protein 1-like n=1 Tax=Lingula anatina TaxID=7574 RepID=A0A1S3ITE5_LINAN|nr:GPALPP motifs-containing protein 1-like [Lingula anatina]|eukprot:XP_013401472.1 GPALPP motifs-containing protein 1-like [Lingula anatina]
MPPSGPTHEESVAAEVERRAENMKKKLLGEDEIETPVVTERESWMTELPPDMGVNLGLGPRKFRSQPLPEKGDRSAWTDTPADRERKAKEMQEGRGSKRQHEEVFISERDRKITAQLQEYNVSVSVYGRG